MQNKVIESVPEFEEKIVAHLKDCMTNGVNFFKAKHIAKDIGCKNPKRIGSTLFKLMTKNSYKDIKIQKWSYALSQTWRVDFV
jgi:uncharacterized protein with gpF-like domain